MIPAIAAEGLAETVDAFCESIGFSVEQTARVFETAVAHGLRVRLHADQLSNGHGAALRHVSKRSQPITSNTPIQRVFKRWRLRALSPCCSPARFTSCARKHGRLWMSCAASVPIALATDCNPGTSPLTSLLLTMNMGATLFGLTVDECIAGITREAARRSGGWRMSARSRPASHATWRSGTSIARPSSSIAWGLTRCTPGCGGANDARPATTRQGQPGGVVRDLSRRLADGRSRVPGRHSPKAPGGRSDRRQGRARLRRQHRVWQTGKRSDRHGRP